MFMVTIHKDSWKKALTMLGAAVLLCGVVLGAGGLVDGARATAAAAAGNTVKSAEDMANFLLGYGVEVDVSTAQVLQVTIPKKFDDSFKAFNEVIQTCGMDLAKYKGKLVEKWVLQSPNRTVENQTAYAVLLVKDAKVIGGYLLYQPSGEVLALNDTLDVQALAAADAAAAGAEAAADAAAAADMAAAVEQECAADDAGDTPVDAGAGIEQDTAEAAADTTAPEEDMTRPAAAEAEGELAGIFPMD